MKYIISAKTKYGKELIKNLRSGGAEVIEFTDVSNLLKMENKRDYVVIFDTYSPDAEVLTNGGFSVEFDVAEDEGETDEGDEMFDEAEKQMELMKANLKEAMKSGSMRKVIGAIEAVREIIKDPQPLVDSLRKQVTDELISIQDKFRVQLDEIRSLIQKGGDSYNSLLPKIKSLESQIDDIVSGFNIKIKSIDGEIGNCVVGVGETKKHIEIINKELSVILKELVSKLTKSDLKPVEDDIKKIKKEIEDIWKELKNVFAYASRSTKDIVQGTTRLMLFLEGVSLNDVFNELDFQAGPGITLTKSLDSTNRRTVLTIAAPGSTTDEKVKLSASDPTAGYLNDKLSASDGISYNNGVLANTDKGSSAVSSHEGTYDHTKIATALQSETDPVWTSEKASYAKLNDSAQTIIAEQFKSVGDIAVTYDGDFVDTITIGTRVITFTNDGSAYTSWTDTVNTWTPTYSASKLTAITVS